MKWLRALITSPRKLHDFDMEFVPGPGLRFYFKCRHCGQTRSTMPSAIADQGKPCR